MIHDKIPVDIFRLKAYFPEFDEFYQSSELVNDGPLIAYVDITLDLNEGNQEAFEALYINLMEKYGFPEDCYNEIFYINQRITHDLNILEDYSTLNPQTQNALDFLIGYQQLVEEVSLKRQKNRIGYREDEEDPIIIQVKDKTSNGGVPLIYDGAGRLIVKMIYKAFKTTFINTSLSYLLEGHEEIPPLEILQSIRTPNVGKGEKIAKEMLSKIAVIQSDYFESYLDESIYSRKKNTILCELFYLFDTLKYAGKVIKIDSSTLARRSLNTDYVLPLDESKHAEFITVLIKNQNKRKKPLSGTFLTFTKL